MKRDTGICTAGGTLLSTLVQFSGAELLKTAVLAAVGAAVSFVVTVICKKLAKIKGQSDAKR